MHTQINVLILCFKFFERRDKLLNFLNQKYGVSVHYANLYKMTYYKKYKLSLKFPAALRLTNISLPIYPKLKILRLIMFVKLLLVYKKFNEKNFNSWWLWFYWS